MVNRKKTTSTARRTKPLKVYADGATLNEMRDIVAAGAVSGFTTNPTLMRAIGVEHYRAFATKALEVVRGLPISFEVIADEFDEMGRQARALAGMAGDARNAFVKIPVTNTRGESSAPLVAELAREGIPLNVTAVFTAAQVEKIGRALAQGTGPAVVSVFAGRIADAGVNPTSYVSECCIVLKATCPRAEMLWASPRQAYDAVLAEKAGCDIITMTPALITKMAGFGRDLEEFSLATVRMFYEDAQAAGYTL